MDVSGVKRCFVIGPIGSLGSPERKHADMLLNVILKPVLEGSYEVRRADDDSTPGNINTRLIEDVGSADLVVADLSFLNANAFYELGIRHASGKPTIHIAADGTRLPFDNVQERTIFFALDDWERIKDAKSKLSSAAQEVGRPDYKVVNPFTTAMLFAQVAVSGDPVAAAVANLQRQIEDVASQLEDLRMSDPDYRRMLDLLKTNPAFSGLGAARAHTTSISYSGPTFDSHESRGYNRPSGEAT